MNLNITGIRNFAAACIAALALGCGAEDPKFANTEVNPSTISVSGIADTVEFTLTTDILNIGGDIASVRAVVENTDLTLDLAKKEDIAAGERWSVTKELTLFKGFSAGTYPITLTATDTGGNVTRSENAATVTVTE